VAVPIHGHPDQVLKMALGRRGPVDRRREGAVGVELLDGVVARVPDERLLFAAGPGGAPIAMVVGLENCPGPEPAVPDWQWVVQTSLLACPSATPQPNASMNLPDWPNTSTRSFPVWAT
jgi:hypothetical protein